MRLRQFNHMPGSNHQMFEKGVQHSDTATCADAIVALIKAGGYLLEYRNGIL
jgi:hypothetical protein